jgi:hypothetical protein
MNKFQLLVNKLLNENGEPVGNVTGTNTAGSGGVFGKAVDFNKVDTKYLMSTSTPKGKKQKKKFFPKVIKRKFPEKIVTR